jgi:hypothetical protein
VSQHPNHMGPHDPSETRRSTGVWFSLDPETQDERRAVVLRALADTAHGGHALQADHILACLGLTEPR